MILSYSIAYGAPSSFSVSANRAIWSASAPLVFAGLNIVSKFRLLAPHHIAININRITEIAIAKFVTKIALLAALHGLPTCVT